MLFCFLLFNCYFVLSITDGRDRIDIKVDGDLTAFLAKGNDTIFVKSPKIRTADDFALEQEYSEYARENQYY